MQLFCSLLTYRTIKSGLPYYYICYRYPEDTPMHYVQLDLNHDNFYCPATGFHMLSAEHYEASPATLFVYPEDAGEFEWYSRELEKLESTINTVDVVDECEDGLSNVERFLAAIKDKPNLVVFTITTSGIACGPVSSTVHICINMDYCKEEEE